MANVWKIAPGEGAEDWDVAREQKCIGLGWTRLGDYAKFKSQEDVLRALKEKYPRGDEEGNREGAARSIWYFVRKIEPDDIVVANNGRGGIVGIGVVTSEYLHPKARNNPIQNDERIRRRHARRVDWVIEQGIDLQQTYFFGINTVTALAPERVRQIRQAYLRKHPEFKEKLAQLLGPA